MNELDWLKHCRQLFLRQHEVLVNIGVHAFEKTAPQRMWFDVELYVDYAHSTSHSDHIDEVVDYDFVRQVIAQRVARGHMELQETLCDDVARELTFTGRIFTGEEAFAMGIATRVCADPRAEALLVAAEIAGKNPDAIRAGKRLLNLAADADQHAILLAESVEQSALIGTPNQVEAVMSNMQKRAAAYAD
jgi:dihydroneopterin aldolase